MQVQNVRVWMSKNPWLLQIMCSLKITFSFLHFNKDSDHKVEFSHKIELFPLKKIATNFQQMHEIDNKFGSLWLDHYVHLVGHTISHRVP